MQTNDLMLGKVGHNSIYHIVTQIDRNKVRSLCGHECDSKRKALPYEELKHKRKCVHCMAILNGNHKEVFNNGR
jgi:hypothetical protein